MKKKVGFWLVVAAVLILCSSTAAAAQQKKFSDVSDTYWAKESIEYLTDRGIINGYPDGRFGIEDPITRAQAAVMIMRYFGWGDLSGQPDPGYPDLTPKYWAYNEIAAVYNLDIFKPKGKFQPELPVTRAEMADMLVKTFDLSSINAVKFKDMDRDHWAYQSVNILAGKGIAKGYPDGTFRPDASVTRAEFAALMSRLMKEEFETVRPGYNGAIYDLEVGGQVYQLEHPLLLTDRWLAPAELFEKMGYYVESHDKNELTITTADGRVIQLREGEKEIWVGDTSVQVTQPLVMIDDQFYIEVSGILRALGKPLVFYPDQFLIRLEAPKITVEDINRQIPEAVIDVVHPRQPYWHWSKRDRDYLELIRREDKVFSKMDDLHEEMNLLTQAYLTIENERIMVRGVNYYSDSVTGKLDAISRGIEARYRLIYNPDKYEYPAVGKSGALGVFRSPNYEFDYIVSDHNFDHYEENKQRLITEIMYNGDLPLEHFRGLNIHGIPFFIREKAQDGSINNWSGLASGSLDMLVVNSGLGTFVHEFGHNWDYKFGDSNEYLKIRGKEGYVPASSDWAHRVGENFAEDFASAFISDPQRHHHKGVFGQPSEEQIESIREYVRKRTPANVTNFFHEIYINGSKLPPNVMYADGHVRIQGMSPFEMSMTVRNLATGDEKIIQLTGKDGGHFFEAIEFPEYGNYLVNVGGKSTIVVYPRIFKHELEEFLRQQNIPVW